MTPRPHDALFKSAFQAPADAAALLCEVLPTAICDAIDWPSLRLTPGEFVDAVLADRRSDLLFSVRLRARDPVPLHVLLEHQSTADPAMPLRVLSYQVRIWDRVLKEQRSERRAPRLPPIIAVVVSHVPGSWRTTRALADLLDPVAMAIPGMAALMPQLSLVVEELAPRSTGDLQALSLGAYQKLALWLLRDARNPARMLASFDAWIPSMIEVEQSPGGIEAFATLITYMFRVADPLHWEGLRAKLAQLGPRAEEAAMTIAEYLHEEGRKRGREEGRVATLRSQLLFKFELRELHAGYEARLREATPEVIDRYLRRVLTADSLAAVFDD